MAEISVRLTSAAQEKLKRICLEQGVSRRALVEATLLCFLANGGPARSEAEAGMRKAVWATAARIDAEAAAARPALDRDKNNVRVEDEILEAARTACQKRGVSVSGLVATAFTPWGSKWGAPEEYAARTALFEKIITVARRIDHERRVGGPVTLEC